MLPRLGKEYQTKSLVLQGQQFVKIIFLGGGAGMAQW